MCNCGNDHCSIDGRQEQSRLVILEEKEKILEARLATIRKLKENLRSTKEMK